MSVDIYYEYINETVNFTKPYILQDDYLCIENKKMYYVEKILNNTINILGFMFVNKTFIDNKPNIYYYEIKPNRFYKYTTNDLCTCSFLNTNIYSTDHLLFCIEYDEKNTYEIFYGEPYYKMYSQTNKKQYYVNSDDVKALAINKYSCDFIDESLIKEAEKTRLEIMKSYTYKICINVDKINIMPNCKNKAVYTIIDDNYAEIVMTSNKITSTLCPDDWIILCYNTEVVKYDFYNSNFRYSNYEILEDEYVFNLTGCDTENKIIVLKMI